MTIINITTLIVGAIAICSPDIYRFIRKKLKNINITKLLRNLN